MPQPPRSTVTPSLTLAAEAGAHLVRGLLDAGVDSTAHLAEIEQRCAALDLAFTSNQCIFFQAVLATHRGDDAAALRALRRCLPVQLELGHIDFLCQEFAQCPRLALLALHDDALAKSQTALLDALAHSVKSVPLFVRLLEGDNRALQDLTIAACRHAPSNVVEELLTWARKHGTARQLRSLRSLLPHDPDGHAPTSDLTMREHQVLALMAEGRRNQEIAARLFLSEKTVKTHVNHIFMKLGVADRVQAVLCYRASIQPGAGQDTPAD